MSDSAQDSALGVVSGGLSLVSDEPIRTGKTQAKKLQAQQAKLLEEQRKKEELRLAEQESEIEKRRVRAGQTKGRSLLVATSPTGTTEKLGGGA